MVEIAAANDKDLSQNAAVSFFEAAQAATVQAQNGFQNPFQKVSKFNDNLTSE